MPITIKIAAEKLGGYLRHELSLEQLVDWAEDAFLHGDFATDNPKMLRQVLGRLGIADVRAFGLSWDDCEQLLAQLGFAAKVEIVPA